MEVYEAVSRRRSIRGFFDRPVAPVVLERVLTAALRAPSGGNLQPWRLWVVTGPKLDDLKDRIRRRVAAGDTGDDLVVPPYPSPLPAPYAARLEEMGAERYRAVGVARDDRRARAAARAGNWECWGASTLLLCYLDAAMLAPQWLDLGTFLQSVMLLLQAEGVDTCPQIAWAEYHRTVAEVIEPPAGLTLACGLTAGYRNDSVPVPEVGRARLGELVTFVA